VKPIPWSYTGLDRFVTCPRQFEAMNVLKTVKDVKGEQQLWGEYVHKKFEERQRDGWELPPELAEHEPYMHKLACLPGRHFTEQKVALSRNLTPCGFFDDNVWNRGVLDFVAIERHVAIIVDYKTGKVKPNLKQLALFALFIFHTYPQVTACYTRYYWTQTKQETEEEFLRGRIPEIWQKFLPDLKQYAEAFKLNIWQPRQSGLCHGWCPVTECEFWKPKRSK